MTRISFKQMEHDPLKKWSAKDADSEQSSE
jgi:hypothetical protein